MAEFNDMLKKYAVLSAYFPSLRKTSRLMRSLLGDFHETSHEHWKPLQCHAYSFPRFFQKHGRHLNFWCGKNIDATLLQVQKLIMDMRDFSLPSQSR